MKILKISRTTILIIIATIALAFFTFKDSLGLALAGDDWLLHYTIWTIFDVQKSLSYLNPLTYLCTYCPHYFFLSIIRHFWGYDPFYYYLASLIFRIGVSFSLFWLIKRITKKTFPAVLASLFFAVNYIGIQTTDWVFNFSHYGGIIIVAFFLIAYYKAKESSKLIHLLPAVLLFVGALIISPPRMHGLYPLVIIAEIGWWIIEGRKYKFWKGAVRLLLLLIAYRLVFSGAGYGTADYNLAQVRKGLQVATEMLSKGNSAFLLNIISSIGNYVIPDVIWAKLSLSRTLHLILLAFVFGLLSYPILYLSGIKKKASLYYLGTLLFWLIFMIFIRRTNLNFYTVTQVGLGLIGGYTVILTLWLFFLLKKTQPLLVHLLLIALGWMLTFSLFPWLIAPYSLFDSSQRYSVQQGAGLCVWIAIIFFITYQGLTQRKLNSFKGILYLFIFGFILMQMISSMSYINLVSANRSRKVDEKLWNKIYSDVPKLSNNGPSVFFLQYDNPLMAEWDLRFGFASRGAIHYNITNQKANPFMIYEYDKLLSMVSDGKALVPQGYDPKPIPLERVYGYVLNNGELTNITAQLKNKLKTDLSTLNKGNQNFQP